MKRPAIVSREYKVMLRPAKFAGAETAVLDTADAFWNEFSAAIADTVDATNGTLRRITKRRLIQFLDTASAHITEGGYILRVRSDENAGRPEVTLKFRHGDRYVAEARRIKGRTATADVKFEEDIKAPFVSLYSYSASVGVAKREMPSNFTDVVKMFPGLDRRVHAGDGPQRLSALGSFTARELVITGSSFRLAKRQKVEAECGLIVWYDHNGADDKPVSVEFSYRYANQSERYGGGAARRAFAAFETLQTLDKWIDPHPRTKTRFVLDKARDTLRP